MDQRSGLVCVGYFLERQILSGYLQAAPQMHRFLCALQRSYMKLQRHRLCLSLFTTSPIALHHFTHFALRLIMVFLNCLSFMSFFHMCALVVDTKKNAHGTFFLQRFQLKLTPNPLKDTAAFEIRYLKHQGGWMHFGFANDAGEFNNISAAMYEQDR